MRKTKFTNGEYYHIFNRGADKRIIFPAENDIERFFRSMNEFNSVEPIGSIFENSFRKDLLGNRVSKSKLVDFICYCLNPNHYHFILKQLTDNGIEKFMHRLSLGYTKYLNKKYNRSGVLFQGPFKAIPIDTNEYLLHLSAYVNLNDKAHQIKDAGLFSSWDEYINNKTGFCNKDIILSQFKSILEYINFAEESLRLIKERKEMEKLLLE